MTDLERITAELDRMQLRCDRDYAPFDHGPPDYDPVDDVRRLVRAMRVAGGG